MSNNPVISGVAADRIPQLLKTPEYNAIKKWVTGQTRVLSDALDAFCEPAEDWYFKTQNPSDVTTRLYYGWQSIIGEATTISHASEHRHRLAEFVVNLAARPTLEKDGQVCVVEDMTVWKDLPLFGWEIRDVWNSEPDSNSDSASKQYWINLNAFMATLDALLHGTTHEDLQFSMFGLWTIRSGLEEQGDIPDVSLAAAAVWLLYAGPTLWAYSNQEKSFEGRVAIPGSSFSQEEWRGFTKARWQAWKQNLQDAQTAVSDQTTADLVKQALKAMDEAEKQ